MKTLVLSLVLAFSSTAFAGSNGGDCEMASSTIERRQNTNPKTKTQARTQIEIKTPSSKKGKAAE